MLERFYGTLGEEVSRRGEAWARQHGLLSSEVRSRVPPAIAEPLRLAALRNAARNLRSIDVFQQAVDALGEVPVCPLKGMALLGTVYAGEIEARVLNDQDLLTPSDLVDEAAIRLASHFGLEETAASAAVRGLTHDRCLQNERLTLELHSQLDFRQGESSSWEVVDPQPGRLHERDVFLLTPEMTLVHLVTHFVKHGPFARLGWVEDILRVGGDVELGAALRAARRIRAKRSFVAGLRAVRWLTGEWPDSGEAGIQDALAGVGVGWHERVVWGRLRRDPLGAPPPGPGRRALSDVLLADSISDALRVARLRLARLVREARR